jgi:crotonobetainyl-CoA:carnitine CoA-transferase CaiB-like acyl-CoA transferase
VTVDVRTPAGQRVVRALARDADALVENFAPGTMDAHGLGYETLEAINPALVVSSITPFGQTGPYAHWKGPDIVRQALGAWMVQGGSPDRPPLQSGGDLALYITGICGAAATLTALHHARATGEGQHVDVSAIEAIVTCAGQEASRVHADGPQVAFTRTGHVGLPFTIVPCRDGWIGINLLFTRNYIDFCEWAGMQDLLDDPRYDTLEKLRRPGRGAELNDRLTAWTRQHSKQWLVDEGQKRRIAMALVPTIDEVLTLPQHAAREFLQTVDHPTAGTYIQPGAPFVMSETPWALTRHAPALGSANHLVEQYIQVTRGVYGPGEEESWAFVE